MYYNFKCKNCHKLHPVDIPMADYDNEKDICTSSGRSRRFAVRRFLL